MFPRILGGRRDVLVWFGRQHDYSQRCRCVCVCDRWNAIVSQRAPIAWAKVFEKFTVQREMCLCTRLFCNE